jgi:hypothetical protein
MIPEKKVIVIFIIFIFGSVLIPTTESSSIIQKKIFQLQNDKNFAISENEGYTLYAPEYSSTTYLIDMDGNIAHTWESDYIQGLAVYLLEDGKLIRNCLANLNPTFLAGGITGRMEIHDWYGELDWEFEYSSDEYCLHHDYEVLPNGNILMIAWESKNRSECILAGIDPTNFELNELWPDHIIEINPASSSCENIVWEWHVWDHLIQDVDPSKNNYGIVEEHPELIDINFLNESDTEKDWLHTNSIDYNKEFDQIILSVHKFNEIWVIDHSTTTEEAAGHIGGNSGKGGDLLYRWGNPKTYRAGNDSDQKLYGQHDAQWIEKGCPGEGNILFFNNGLNRPGIDYSSVDEIIPPVNENGEYFIEEGKAYGPEKPIWSYIAKNPKDFYSSRISGAQRLNNGNTLICVGDVGFFFEVTHDKEIVWKYTNPYPNHVFNDVFKIRRYQSNYNGLKILINAPLQPTNIKGPSQGKKGVKYTYYSSTIDPQGDLIYILFDWGDGTDSGWLGPYNSSERVYASHIWEKTGSYEIKVKALDINNFKSIWSKPLEIFIPRTRQTHHSFVQWLFEKFNILQIFFLKY